MTTERAAFLKVIDHLNHFTGQVAIVACLGQAMGNGWAGGQIAAVAMISAVGGLVAVGALQAAEPSDSFLDVTAGVYFAGWFVGFGVALVGSP